MISNCCASLLITNNTRSSFIRKIHQNLLSSSSMNKPVGFLLVCLFAISCSSNEQGSTQSKEPTILGSWKVLESEKTTNDTTIISKPHKSIYLFTDSFYSIAIAPRERASLSQNAESADISAAEAGYISNSGTYEIIGDSIRTIVLVSKFPNFMNNRSQRTQHIAFEGDRLILTLMNGESINKTILQRYSSSE